MAIKAPPLPPVNQSLGVDPWVMNEIVLKATKPLMIDFSKTPQLKDGTRVTRQFSRYSRSGVTDEIVVSKKVFVQPLEVNERNGPRWGSVSKSHAL
jgi:hypothetical protein